LNPTESSISVGAWTRFTYDWRLQTYELFGQFGPGLKALVVSQYFQGNMTQGKLLEFLSDIGISICAGQLSNLLIKDHKAFHTEKQEVYQAGAR